MPDAQPLLLTEREDTIIVRYCACGQEWAGGNSKYCPSGHAYQFNERRYVPLDEVLRIVRLAIHDNPHRRDLTTVLGERFA